MLWLDIPKIWGSSLPNIGGTYKLADLNVEANVFGDDEGDID